MKAVSMRLCHRLAAAGLVLTRRAARLLLLLLLPAFACHALEIQTRNPFPEGPTAGVARELVLQGEVLPGDADKLLQWIRSKPADAWHALGRVDLAISGGDVREALRLGELLAGLYPHMVVRSDCAAACAIVWLAGAWRVVPTGKIGLERPPPAVPARVAADAPPPYDPLPDQLRAYLLKQGVPPPLAERVLSGSPGAVDWLSEKDINLTGVWPPYYFEKLRTHCPLLLSSTEGFHSLRRCAAGLVISQKAFALDRLLDGVDDRWWNENRDIFKNAPR